MKISKELLKSYMSEDKYGIDSINFNSDENGIKDIVIVFTDGHIVEYEGEE